MNLAASNVYLPAPLCTLLWILLIVLFVLGLLEVFNVKRFFARPYAACIGFLVVLVIYIVFC
jgi:hypothetical protein